MCNRLFCLLFVFILHVGLLTASASQPICLNMIVKNESAVIKRCLASVKPLIDYWVIVDTGSTDGTQEIIKEYMKDIPGDLYERPWKNFAHNRNEALQLAQGKGAYFLFMDADDWLEYEPGFQWPLFTHDLYAMWRKSNESSFVNHHLIRAGLPWVWVGVVHEYLSCSQPYTYELLENVWYHVENDGASHQDPKKFAKYIELLEEALEKDPNNMRDIISLAKSYKGAGQMEKALSLYEKVVTTCLKQEEVFWALIQIGSMKWDVSKMADEAISSYYRAHRLYPVRAEPIYFLANIYNSIGRFDLSYACIKAREELPFPHEKGTYFNFDWMEEYGLSFELAVCSLYVGKHQESLALCDRLLSMKNIPTEIRKVVEKIRQLAIKKALVSQT